MPAGRAARGQEAAPASAGPSSGLPPRVPPRRRERQSLDFPLAGKSQNVLSHVGDSQPGTQGP